MPAADKLWDTVKEIIDGTNKWLVPDSGGHFALFLVKQNISSYIGPLADSLMKRVRISYTYVLVK